MKRFTMYVLLSYFILQLAVPGYFVYRHYNTLYTGDTYKFKVALYDPYDPFRGRYVALSPVLSINSEDGEYALLEKDSDGYAVITKWQQVRPKNNQYVKNLILDCYYMNENLAPEAERIQRGLDNEKDITYLAVKVKNGDYVIQGLYINDMPIEQYILEGGE